MMLVSRITQGPSISDSDLSKKGIKTKFHFDCFLQRGRQVMTTFPFSASNKLSHIEVRLMDSPYVTDLITVWDLRRIGVRGSRFPPFSVSTFKVLSPGFAPTLQSTYLRRWINIPSCSSKELQQVTSQESVT
jgi:hypothetical protein